MDLERRSPDEVAAYAASHLPPEVREELVEWVLRAGLGNVFVNQRTPEVSPRTLGLLISISFDPETDPAHRDLYDSLHDWTREDGTCVHLYGEEAAEIADLLEQNERTLIAEFASEPVEVEETEGGEWAAELRRRAEE